MLAWLVICAVAFRRVPSMIRDHPGCRVAALPLSPSTLAYLAGVIRSYRRQIGSCWRKCNAGQQALLVPAHLRKGETFADLAAGFGIGTSTAWRYVRETVALLAARAPKLPAALAAAKKVGHAFVVIDGTLITVDRLAADWPFYSGKHRRHGMNLQVISNPAGEILWVSGPLPGAVHDLTAARLRDIIRQLAAAGLIVLADKGYIGAGQYILTSAGAEQARLPENRQLRARQTARPRRTRQRPAQDLGNPVQTPLLPLARLPDRQSQPRPPSSRDRRMKTLTASSASGRITVSDQLPSRTIEHSHPTAPRFAYSSSSPSAPPGAGRVPKELADGTT